METVVPTMEIVEEIRQAGGDAYRFCYQCGKCDVVCPWNRVARFSMRRTIREASLGLPSIESEDLWRCTTCGTCPQQCPRGVKQIEIGVALRRLASSYDVFPASARAARTVRAGLLTDGNPLGGERAKRADWARGLDVKPFAEGTEMLFFTCCYLGYDPRMRKVAAATARLLERAGVDFGILGEKESCCGESVRKTGGEAVWKTLARENIKAFVDAGVRKILVSSPHCYHTIKNEYSELMVNFEVVHSTQLLLDLVRSGKLGLGKGYGKRVTWHDPCYLGRHNGIYDEPREILRRIPGLELVEMESTREASLCCGGGGGRVWMDTPKGERFSDLRLGQARAVGAEVIATACPYCITMFEEARLKLEGEYEIAVKDVTEILEEAVQ